MSRELFVQCREMEQPAFLRVLRVDGVHHRGQLSASIRPMGGKVPAIYGASGDQAPPRG